MEGTMEPTCYVCGSPAEVIDIEYDELYCTPHAKMYEVFDGPHRWLDDDADGESASD